MKRVAKILVVSVLSAVVMSSWRGLADDAAAPTTATPPDTTKLSPPARDIVKMTMSGVPEDVIRSFINNSPSVYALTPDNIINLQGVGVTASVTTAMLNHDKTIRDNAPMIQPPMQNQPPQQPGAPYPQTADQPVQTVYQPATETVYDYTSLQPYGTWTYLVDYGWCWEPFGWLGYGYYPWGLLRWGHWWNCPGRGWCWFPGSHFRSPGFFAGGGHHFNNGNFGHTGHTGITPVRGSAGFGHGSLPLSRPTTFNRSTSVNHAFSAVRSMRSAGVGASHFSGGGHSGGGGAHFSGGGHSGGHR